MKQIFWKVVMFVTNVHRSGTKESASRFYGGLGLIISYITIPVYSFWYKDPELLMWLLVTTATLLLGKTAETIFKSEFAGKYGNRHRTEPGQNTPAEPPMT